MKRLIGTLAMASALATGSAHASDATVTKDRFDGATRVSINPHGLNCGMTMLCAAVGAQWSSKDPDAAVLEFEVLNSYSAIDGAKLNIDGKIVDLQAVDNPTRYERVDTARGVTPMRLSKKGFLVPMSLVRDILAAQSCQVRVSTADGTIDGTLIDGKKNSKALGALQRFVAKVPANEK